MKSFLVRRFFDPGSDARSSASVSVSSSSASTTSFRESLIPARARPLLLTHPEGTRSMILMIRALSLNPSG